MDSSCLITVGTTCFDELIETLNSNAERFCAELYRRGISKLFVQYGSGTTSPDTLCETASREFGIECESFPFVPSLSDLLEESTLVVSHAGAGTILETLRLKDNSQNFGLIVVVNQKLMDNHQMEIATKLEKDKHLRWCFPQSLCQELETSEFGNLVPLPPVNSEEFVRILEESLFI